MDEFFGDVRKSLGENGHRMMRVACERIHDALKEEPKEEEAVLLAVKVVQILDQVTVEMLQALDRLVQDDLVQYRNQKIKDGMRTDGSLPEGSEYEVVG